MQVNTIRDRVVELAHQSGADGEVKAKALNWVNAAYMELMNELLALAPQSLQRTETLSTDSSGVAILSAPPAALVRVLWGQSALNVVTPLAVLEADPSQTALGEPVMACPTATGVQVQPRKAGSVQVVYLPTPLPLAEDGPASSILLAPRYHDALIWGGLMWSALFERGLSSVTELNMFSRQWAEAKARIRLGMLSQSGMDLRVRGERD
jgi:hypothetical protein